MLGVMRAYRRRVLVISFGQCLVGTWVTREDPPFHFSVKNEYRVSWPTSHMLHMLIILIRNTQAKGLKKYCSSHSFGKYSIPFSPCEAPSVG